MIEYRHELEIGLVERNDCVLGPVTCVFATRDRFQPAHLLEPSNTFFDVRDADDHVIELQRGLS